MEYSGLATVAAPRRAVWALLTDPAALEACVPGLRELVEIEPEQLYQGALVLPLGNQEVRLPALVRWLERVEEKTGRLHVVTNFAGTTIEITTGMTLSDHPTAITHVRWQAHVAFPDSSENRRRFLIGLLQNIALKAIDEFFVRIKEKLEVGSEK